MGQISSAPVELIRVQRGGGKHWRCAVAEMQGWRADHEDAHFMRDGATEEAFAIFGVLDGHGGCEVARLAAHQRLPPRLQGAADGAKSVDDLEAAVSAVFVETDAWLRERPEVTRDQSGSTCVVAGLKKKTNAKGGATRYQIFLANAGDSRGLVLRRRRRRPRRPENDNGKARDDDDDDMEEATTTARRTQQTTSGGFFASLAAPLESASASSSQGGGMAVVVASDDHKPDRRDEHARIAAAGGFVSDVDAAKRVGVGAANVVARLDGNLAVSRGLGDFAYKRDSRRRPEEQKVSCVPELYHAGSPKDGLTLKPGDVLVLACDGIFDVMTNDDLAKAIASALCDDVDVDFDDGGGKKDTNNKEPDLGDLAARILTACLHNLNSKDNMTLMIVEVGVDGSDYAYRPSENRKINHKKKKSNDERRRRQQQTLETYLLAPTDGREPTENTRRDAEPSVGPPPNGDNATTPFDGDAVLGDVLDDDLDADLDDDDDLDVDDDSEDDSDDDDDGRAVDEIVGVDQYHRQCDEAVKRSYISFLEYCDTDQHRKLPREARQLLKRVAKHNRGGANGRSGYRRRDDDDDDDDDDLGLGFGSLEPIRH